MAMKVSAKDEIRRRLDDLSEDEALDLLDYLNLQQDPDVLTAEEMAEVKKARDRMRRGEYVTLEEILRREESD